MFWTFDGSDLANRLLGNPLAQQWSECEAETPGRFGLGILGPPGRLADLEAPAFASSHSFTLLPLTPTTRDMRQGAIRPRRDVAQTLRSSPSPTDDPPQTFC